MTAAWRKFGAWLSAVSPKGAKSSEEPCRFLTASARFVGRLEGFGAGPLGRGEGSEHRHRAPWNKRHAQLRKTCALRLALRFLFSGFEENNFKERLYQATSRLEPPRAADAGIPRFKSATLFCCFVSFFGFSLSGGSGSVPQEAGPVQADPAERPEPEPSLHRVASSRLALRLSHLP